MKTKLCQKSSTEAKLIDVIRRILKDCDDYDKTQVKNKDYEGILSECTGERLKEVLPDLYKKYFF